jgi:L-idonate 5-dehydrogenase
MSMHALVARLHGARDLRLETLPLDPPGPGEVLIALGAGGICGSDLHYYHDGGFGPIRVREPIIPGHELAGTVTALGPGVASLAEGDRVAVNPSRPCGACRFCTQDLPQHCLAMRFFGSALTFPHVQGGFRSRMVVPADQCVALDPATPFAAAACAEPLAVCLHAADRAGPLDGARVLVTGAGPIGALMTAVARHAGAAEVVATDLADLPLAIAARMGATATLDVARDPEALAPWGTEKGRFDAAFECSAAAPALAAAITATRPRGTIVQVGVTGDLALPVNLLVGKEIALLGTHRFTAADYTRAVRLIEEGAIDPAPIVTHAFPLTDAVAAFDTAGDRRVAVKVLLTPPA